MDTERENCGNALEPSSSQTSACNKDSMSISTSKDLSSGIDSQNNADLSNSVTLPTSSDKENHTSSTWDNLTTDEITELPPANTLRQAFEKLVLPTANVGEKYRHVIRIFTRNNSFEGKFIIQEVSFQDTKTFKASFDEKKGLLFIEGVPDENPNATLLVKYLTQAPGLFSSNKATTNELSKNINIKPDPSYETEENLTQAISAIMPQLPPANVGELYDIALDISLILSEEFANYITLNSFLLENGDGIKVEQHDHNLIFNGIPIKDGNTSLVVKYKMKTRLHGELEREYKCNWVRILPDPILKQKQELDALFQNTSVRRLISDDADIVPIEFDFPFVASYPRIKISGFSVDDTDLSIKYSPEDFKVLVSGKARTLKASPKSMRTIDLICHYQLIYTSGIIENDCVSFPILTINPSPKDLWNNLPTNPDSPYQSPDQVHKCIKAEKTLIGASKRGRSHAHNGKFRDDNFMIDYIEETGWYIVAVSDGAGSAEFSREGSRIACETFCNILKERLTQQDVNDKLLAMTNEEQEKALKGAVLKAAYQGVVNIDQEAQNANQPRKKYAATFLGYIMKKVNNEWLIVSMGIGDGIISLFDNNQNLILMSEPDGGEFVGQTRFITMNEVWQDNPAGRLHSVRLADFSFIMSMTDGVSDPKFETDNNLKNQQIWSDLWKELQASIPLGEHSDETAQALENWLDFWAKGNHDDRTIVIAY